MHNYSTMLRLGLGGSVLFVSRPTVTECCSEEAGACPSMLLLLLPHLCLDLLQLLLGVRLVAAAAEVPELAGLRAPAGLPAHLHEARDALTDVMALGANACETRLLASQNVAQLTAASATAASAAAAAAAACSSPLYFVRKTGAWKMMTWASSSTSEGMLQVELDLKLPQMCRTSSQSSASSAARS
eukprot:CAMPEP_0203882368 /NCGR_PEP_ID=MMETSP0359-20131031/26602_1 /ASSEMBLY_ACC=CAM_ASM_000338 /TAXON_ID=268821 /ORGANISM="Scrippsiella Hangoei, Strain SHTV-5" /LENGTH=185 /DNA_ID=CAMNT_0050802403 /DNA_START=57 /DNA_END=612 /DNA_ORIENTATION=+